ncbi:MAG TPA: heavy-metal-associated domain-containing protein, partial [Hyphomicrobium sp.]|nr:heavy-metal-associated domain-containing protein [Hyphomicrobium sp.]
MEATLTAPVAGNSRASAVTVTLSVPDIVCGSCIRIVETALKNVRGVSAARANLAMRRVTVTLCCPNDNAGSGVTDLVAALRNVGYSA